MSITFSVSVGYQRRRPDISDKVESRMDAVGLMLIGGFVVVLIIWLALPRVLAWLGTL